MKYPYIKNIAHEEALALSGQVVTQPGQIVSKTLAQNGAVSITLFAERRRNPGYACQKAACGLCKRTI